MATAVDDRWSAVLRRDAAADGRFLYGVTSTRVFCRPSCPSRRPRADRVRFFESAIEALRAGFRPCRRCRPDDAEPLPPPVRAVHRAAVYLQSRPGEPVSLARLSRVAQLSPSHLQRQFARIIGVSPREYQAACRASRFRRQLRAGADVATATYAAGYGSPSRVYEARPTGAGMAPAVYRRGGEGAEIGHVTIDSHLGWLLIAATPAGLCAVKLGSHAGDLVEALRHEFPHASIAPDRLVPQAWIDAVLALSRGRPVDVRLPLDVRGTAFQWRVWRALHDIPAGETRSYGEVARALGQPSSARAVARACAQNPLGLVVPCHRVVPREGGTGGYRWGASRKARLLSLEAKGSKIPPE